MAKEDTQFKKGQSGNPGGRPKGKHLTTLLFEALKKKARNKDGTEAEKTYQDLLIDRILLDAITKGNTSLIHLVMSYIDGAPEEFIDITSNGGSISQSSDDVMEMVKRVSAELKKKKTTQ